MDIMPCPFCGSVPNIDHPLTFQTTESLQFGYVVCCCNGPMVKTNYMGPGDWWEEAVEAWNKRRFDGEAQETGSQEGFGRKRQAIF